MFKIQIQMLLDAVNQAVRLRKESGVSYNPLSLLESGLEKAGLTIRYLSDGKALVSSSSGDEEIISLSNSGVWSLLT